jgi:LysW-gamma-L-lysine carboxypeptidase
MTADRDRQVLEALVRVPSVTGREQDAVRLMQDQARRDGFRVVEDKAGNFIAEAGTGPRLLLFCGHIDTVPGAIDVRVEGDELWGRGSVDAKGPLAAAYCAARRHLDSKEVTVRVVGAVDEEGDSRGAKALDLSRKPEWVIVGEPSGVDAVTIAYKGILRGAFTLRRPRHHAAHPGATAVEQAIAWWTEVSRRHAFADTFDALQGHLLSLTTQSDGLVDEVVGRFNVRIPPGVDVAGLQAELAASAEERHIVFAPGERMAPAVADRKSPLVAAFLSSIRATGGEPRLLRKTGTADFNHLAEWLPGTPIVAYGPGDASLDHTPHERIDLRDFDRAVDILDRVFQRFARMPVTASSAAPGQVPAVQAPGSPGA